MRELIRFALVGVAFSLIYALTTAALTSYAAAPPVPTAIGVYLACIPLAYAAQARWAFRRAASAGGAPWIYAATQIASLAVVTVLTRGLASGQFWRDAALYLVCAGAAALISFAICRWIIFAPKAPDA